MFRFLIYKFGQFCVQRLPLKLAYRIAMSISEIHYLVHFNDRRAVKNNLKIILQTEEDVSLQAREVFRNFGKYLVDFFRMQKTLDESYVSKNIKLQNFDRMDKELSKGKGAIILTAHIGNWELGAAVMCVLGHPILAVALPHKERPVNDLFNKQREAWGMVIVPSHLAVRKCLEALKNNHLIALVADRDFTSHGEELDFLTKKAMIPKGPAVFSVKTGAPIIPTFLVRNPDDSFTFFVEEAIYPPQVFSDVAPDEVILSIMKRYTQVIENKIHQFPTQWLMFREFWVKK